MNLAKNLINMKLFTVPAVEISNIFSNEVMDVITLAELLYQILIIFEFISF